MTTPKPPLPREINNSVPEGRKTPWYSVPVVWVGIGIVLMLIAGLIHLAIVGHRYASDALDAVPESKRITHIRGMPLEAPKPAQDMPAKQTDK